MIESLNTQILRLCVYLEQDAEIRTKFVELIRQISDWKTLIEEAESSAVSNLLYRHVIKNHITIPEPELTSLRALTARHTRNNRERIFALEEILEQFERESIESVLLKGMSLIHTLYSNHAQRPMGDIDILVRPEQANNAQKALRDIGYTASDRKAGYGYDHHHLPMATKKRNGLVIQVEIHHNALSGDVKSDMTFHDVCDGLIGLNLGEFKTHVLGHQDQLKHLCHHTFEPCDKIKLGAVADIYGYASKFVDEIQWKQIEKSNFIIHNTLRCLHYLSPLPNSLNAHLIAPTSPPPSGVGYGFPTLSSTLVKSKTSSEKFKRIFMCSHWWMHNFYQVRPEQSLLTTQIVRHPAMIIRWLIRRVKAILKSRLVK